MTANSTPLQEIKDSDGRPHRLLVKASAGISTSSDATALQRAVTAPQVPIESTGVPGTDGSATPVGHYAWWVGDEGVKARANLTDTYAADSTDAGKLRRRTSAQRPAIEAITTNGSDGFATGYPVNNFGLLSKVISPEQMTLLDDSISYQDALKTHFHDLTTSSRGVLADTKNGGLKRDLSYILGQSNSTNFRNALTKALEIGTTIPESTPALSTISTVYATLPSDRSGQSGTSSYNAVPGILSFSATWDQLWSFHNIGNLTSGNPAGAFNLNSEAMPRDHTSTQHGLYPLITQCKVFYRLRIVDGSVADGANRTGKIWIDSIPVAVLANPYNVPLAKRDYTLKILISSPPKLMFGYSDSINVADHRYATDYIQGYTNVNPMIDATEFILRAPVMQPGEALIFTIDPSASANPSVVSSPDGERIPVVTTGPAKKIVMKNDFDPVPALTFNTNQSIPSTPLPPITDIPTRAALQSGAPMISTRLFLDYTVADGDKRLVQFIRGQQYTAETGVNFLIVNPMSDGVRQGGGGYMMLNEPPTPLTPAQLVPQQSVFSQVNYRSMIVFWSGESSLSHPLEWARTFGKNGSTGVAGSTPNPFIEGNLLRPANNTTNARWGLVSAGKPANPTVPPDSIGGASAGDVGLNNLLYDLPRAGEPLSSLGQLQHFNTAGFISGTNFNSVSNNNAQVVNAWQNNYPLSNSYAHSRVPRDQLFYWETYKGYHFDGSYLWNDVLWDRFFLSSYPASGSFDFASDKLTNARLRPFRDTTTVAWNDTTQFRGDTTTTNAANSRRAAQNLMVEGAFNINSTSVDAWKAVFSSLKNVPIGKETTTVAPFSRTLHQTGGATDSKLGNNVNAWTGIRDLTTAEITALAEEMVLQVRRRGPFLSLSEFVNRRLITPANDAYKIGLSGALQSALDRVINNKNNVSEIASPFNVSGLKTLADNAMVDVDYVLPSALAGFPGYVLQGDVLSTLGSSITARSDTFTIRTYGDTLNPITGEISGRAWCEAVVQRMPDYVAPLNGSSGNSPDQTATDTANKEFGRRYQIVSFRWLSPNEV